MRGGVIQDAGWSGGQHLMSRPLSMDLRQRVVAALARWESTRAVAARFGVAVSSVVKWSQRYRATGSVAPGKMGGHRKRRVTDVLAKAGLPPNWLNLRHREHHPDEQRCDPRSGRQAPRNRRSVCARRLWYRLCVAASSHRTTVDPSKSIRVSFAAFRTIPNWSCSSAP